MRHKHAWRTYVIRVWVPRHAHAFAQKSSTRLRYNCVIEMTRVHDQNPCVVTAILTAHSILPRKPSEWLPAKLGNIQHANIRTPVLRMLPGKHLESTLGTCQSQTHLLLWIATVTRPFTTPPRQRSRSCVLQSRASRSRCSNQLQAIRAVARACRFRATQRRES